MNTATIPLTPAARPETDAGAPRAYRPRLSFYHANSKGTGSAARLEVVPATGERDGAIFMTLAQQKSVASGSTEQGNRQHATFDWQNRVTVKLNNSIEKVLRSAPGWNPPAINFVFLDSAVPGPGIEPATR